MDGKVAAIAITLIVAIPLLLGYALAFTEEERTSWESTDSVNITDSMLNSSSPTFVNYTGPSNNSGIYTRIYYPGAGVTETSLLAPNFVSTGGVYSSIQTFTTSTGTFSVQSAHTTTSTGTDHGTYTEFIVSDWGLYPYVYITTDELSQMYYDGGGSYLGTAFGPFVEIGGAYYGTLGGNTVTTDVIRIVSDRSPTYTMTYREYTDVPDTLGNYYSFTVPQWTAIRIFYNNGGGALVTPNDGVNTVVRSGTQVIVNGIAYNNVSDLVQIAPQAGYAAVNYTKLTASGYADPSYGWNLDLSPGNVVYPYWMNGQVNQSIRMLATIESGEFVDVSLLNDNDATSAVSIRSVGGMIQVNGTNLGKYTRLCLDITGSQIKVSGIAGWPDMATAPALINSITVDFSNPLDLFTMVYLSGSSSIEYRVDSAVVRSGSFASTKDYTVNMASLWPNDSYSIRITSAGIYGDSIQFGGESYTVTDGAITVDDTRVRLLNCAFGSTYDTETATWSNTINGYEVSTSASASSVYFGGEWSITVAAYKMQSVTDTELTWNAGEFAFNGFDSDFALMGLLACLGVFIALGIYGRHSGAKVGALLLICACAGFVFLAMI